MATQVLPSGLLPPLQAVAHALLVVLVRLHAARRAMAALWTAAAARLAAAVPPLRPLLAAVCMLPPREHIGSRPRPPTVLGVVVAEELSASDWPAATDGLGVLLAWCVWPLVWVQCGEGRAPALCCFPLAPLAYLHRTASPYTHESHIDCFLLTDDDTLACSLSAGRKTAVLSWRSCMNLPASCSTHLRCDSWSCSCCSAACTERCTCKWAGR